MFDVYGDRINQNDIYFRARGGNVLLSNIERHLVFNFNDYTISKLKTEKERIDYVSNNYFYDVIIYKRENHFNKMF
jgi:hypothetical protein